ncbi:MAG: proline dehydrogenase family protein [Candidatus Solibacter sp.]|nr:proline dehydrogenase family protein [Candidatus Solibacter sp.]
METASRAQRLSTRFVAGETLDQALAVSRRLHAEGITVTLDHLGESVSTLEEAAEARDIYLRTLDAIHTDGIQGNVSLKLTQFGLDLSYEQCLANVDQLVRRAAELGSFVRVDMESSGYTDGTLELVYTLHARHGAVGVVIQSYLYRSQADIDKLCAAKIRVRLCKGAYLEPAAVAFPRKSDVDRSYLELTRYLLQNGVYPALATHDEAIIRQTCRFVTERQIPRDSFEFQMLYGIRRDVQRRLVAEGYRVRLYVPFGKAWYPYYMRRLAERPANVLFILRNLFRR